MRYESIYDCLPMIVSAVLFIIVNIRIFMKNMPVWKRALESVVVFLVSFLCCKYLAEHIEQYVVSFLADRVNISVSGIISVNFWTQFVMILLFVSLYHVLVSRRIDPQCPIDFSMFIYYQFVNADCIARLLGESTPSYILLEAALFIFWLCSFKEDLEYVREESVYFDKYVFIILQNIVWILISALCIAPGLLPDGTSENIRIWLRWISLGLYVTNIIIVKAMMHAMRVRAENARIRNTDETTGLMSGEYFRMKLNDLVNSEQKTGYAICYYNIVHFTAYNEKNGFEAGNTLLREVGSVLRKVHQHNALVARLSDDHFAVCAPKEKIESEVKLIHGLVRGIQMGAGVEIITGIYYFKQEDTEPRLCIDRAKYACDTLKSTAPLPYRTYDKELDDKVKRERYIVENIDKALAYGHIEVYYQPIISAISGKVINCEALARWNDPVYGMISPTDFVEILEQHYKIHKLDQHVIRKVCQDLNELKGGGYNTVPVSVNLSRRDMQMMDAVSYVDTTLKTYNISKDMIIIEITETAIADDVNYMLAQMARFREAGYKVWLDDFGSGYSSLNILKDFEFDGIKLDMLFLRSFNSRSQQIVGSLINMSKSLSISVLAEGVENEEQLGFLKDIGCDKAQGYLISRPEPIATIKENFLR